MTTFLKLVLMTSCSLVFSGCAPIAAWERGNLAKPQMALDTHPLQTQLLEHNYSSREAGASIKASSSGGGCGCY